MLSITPTLLFDLFIPLLLAQIFFVPIHPHSPLLPPHRAPFQLHQQHRHSRDTDQRNERKAPPTSHTLNHDIDNTRSTSTDEATYEIVGCCRCGGGLWI